MKRNWTFGVLGFATITTLLVFSLAVATAGTDNNGNTSQDKACWGQATAVFARAGEMGIHASEQEEPRAGLRNLARELYDMGVIDEPSMQALGAFVADAWGLTIDACM